MHVDAVTSIRKSKNLVHGHCWVELGWSLTSLGRSVLALPLPTIAAAA
jgi:hypothetical protein